jgi:hypothetical protein
VTTVPTEKDLAQKEQVQPVCLKHPHKKHKVSRTVGPFILIAFVLGVILLIPQGEDNPSTLVFSQSYTYHDPIRIDNDDELAAVANSGTGTANDPYLITGWNI